MIEEKKCELMSCVEVFSKFVIRYYDPAGVEDIKILVIEANAIRRSVIEKKKTIVELDNALEN